jgi:NADPH-dependent 2,4-dienoyl-CoA reductase/sulfur reductase-like enzyme
MFASRRRVVGSSIILAAAVTGVAAGSHRISSADGKDRKSQKIVVVGGGTAGIGVAAMLRNEGMKDVTIIEPQSNHYYQPLWTLVGAGYKDNADSVRKLKDIVPAGVQWVQKAVKTFEPEKNQVTLNDGTTVDYDYLVVAGGLQIDWKKIPGLVEGLESPDSGVVSIYDYNHSDKTFRSFEKVKEHAHRMLFTMPVGLIKCAGAPQKIMWLLEDLLREQGLRDRTSIEFWVPGGAMFGIKRYADQLEVLRAKRGVDAHFKEELVSIDVAKKVAVFKNLDTNTTSEQHYDLLHVCPPMSAPEFIKTSPLASKEGWMEVNKHTLQSTKYANVFGLGDCTNTPNSKTAAAITAQAPVLVHNLTRAIDGQSLNGQYNGYASCPLIVKKHRVILAEFGYDGKIMESFDSETGKFPMNLIGQQGEYQQQFFYWLKEQLFPFAYWNLWVRGRWYGTNGPFKPDVTAAPAPVAPPANK